MSTFPNPPNTALLVVDMQNKAEAADTKDINFRP
jgi:nicotinamidase-related amidase